MPILTDIPQMEEQFRRTFLTENCETSAMVKNVSKRYVRSYTLTPTEFGKNSLRSDYLLISGQDHFSDLGKQVSIISISNLLFQGSRPLGGKEMEVLNKTFTRLRSTTPTKL